MKYRATLSPGPSPKREGSQNQRPLSPLAALVALALPSQGRVAEGRERAGAAVNNLPYSILCHKFAALGIPD